MASEQNILMEPVSDALKRQANEGKSIEIHRLMKQFGEKTAVEDLTLSMYSGQVTALLGHNGKCENRFIYTLFDPS
jgi:ABC-type transporter Mla maintaining outer membrane lipid asymmetry ATPase subunit MlaF